MADLAHPATVVWLVCAEALLAGIGARALAPSRVCSGALLDLLAYTTYTLAASLAPHSVGAHVAAFALCLPLAHALGAPAPAVRAALGEHASRRVLVDAWLCATVSFALALLALTAEVGEKGAFAFWPLYSWCAGSFTLYGALASRLACPIAPPFDGDEDAVAVEHLPPARGAPPAHALGSDGGGRGTACACACRAVGSATAALPAAAARALLARSAMAQTALVWAHRLARAAQRASRAAGAARAPARGSDGHGCACACSAARSSLPLSAFACALALLYGCALRAKTWAPPFLCSPVPSADDEACARGEPLHALRIGQPWPLSAGLHGWAYGAHTADAPPFDRLRVASHGEPNAERGRIAVVIASRGDTWQYAQPVVVCVHTLRAGVASRVGVEVLHVGEAEAFSADAVRLLESYGGVRVFDMLPHLSMDMRAHASLLRSFAAKPYALLAASCELCVLCDANLIFFESPHILFAPPAPPVDGGGGGAAAGASAGVGTSGALIGGSSARGLALFSDYVRLFRTLDPLYVHSHIHIDTSALARGTRGAEIDSSLVAIDKRSSMRALLAVCALNRLRAQTYRHMHGDKDTWALGALLAGIDEPVSARTRVGWLVRAPRPRAGPARGVATDAPSETVWGHVQFVDGRPISLNWQPHYARGFVDFAAAAAQGEGEGAGASGVDGRRHADGAASRDADDGRTELHCCAMFAQLGAGPHDLPHPPIPLGADGSPAGLPGAMRRSFAAARDAITLVNGLVGEAAPAESAAGGRARGARRGGSGSRLTQRASPWSDVGVRKAAIYAVLTVLALSCALLRMPAALRAARQRPHPPRARGSADPCADVETRVGACARGRRCALVLAAALAASLLGAAGSRAVRVPLFFDGALGALAQLSSAPVGNDRGAQLLAAVERLLAVRADGVQPTGGAPSSAEPARLWASVVHVTARDAAKADGELGAWRALGVQTRVADDAQARRDVSRAADMLSLPAALGVYDRAPSAVLRADMWRLAVVWLEGGIYADSDVEPRPRLRALLEAAAAMPLDASSGDGVQRPGLLLFVENWSFIPTLLGKLAIAVGLSDFARFPQYRNCIFAAAAPAHPLLESAFRLATARLEDEERAGRAEPPSDSRVLELTGPGLLTDATNSFLALHGAADIAFVDRGSGMAFFIHAGVGSWKSGAVKSGYTERKLVLLAGAGLALCAAACVLSPARGSHRSKGPHSME